MIARFGLESTALYWLDEYVMMRPGGKGRRVGFDRAGKGAPLRAFAGGGAPESREGREKGEFKVMPNVSIRARLIFLSVLLLAILAASSALLIRELARDSQSLAEEAALVSVVKSANSASKHFGDLKYWEIDSAVTQLVRSRQAAEAAKAGLELRSQGDLRGRSGGRHRHRTRGRHHGRSGQEGRRRLLERR